MSKSSVLVTGATGFIGSQVVSRWLKRGKTAIARNVSGSSRPLEELRGQVETKIGCFTDILRLVETHWPGTSYHLGAMLAPACDGHPEAGIRANAIGTCYSLEAAFLPAGGSPSQWYCSTPLKGPEFQPASKANRNHE